MAKSLRSKIMRRWRKLKRGHIDNVVMKERQSKIFQNTQATLAGIDYRQKQKPNAFLSPNHPQAVFPQFKPAPIIDLRSTSIPGSGREWSGAKLKNKTITQEFKDYDIPAEDNEQIQQKQEQKKDEGEMKEEKAAPTASNKIKKTRKSKLRKTMVF